MPEHKGPVRCILTEPWREVNGNEALMADCTEQLALGVKAALEKCFDCEMLEQPQAAWGRHDPNRVDRWNGYRKRSLQTRFGLVANLQVPRNREAVDQSHILGRSLRSWGGTNGARQVWRIWFVTASWQASASVGSVRRWSRSGSTHPRNPHNT